MKRNLVIESKLLKKYANKKNNGQIYIQFKIAIAIDLITRLWPTDVFRMSLRIFRMVSFHLCEGTAGMTIFY